MELRRNKSGGRQGSLDPKRQESEYELITSPLACVFIIQARKSHGVVGLGRRTGNRDLRG